LNLSDIAICTLFEGDYHKGLAGLVNSLARQGFQGPIYAGYRGSIPYWAESSTLVQLERFGSARKLQVSAQIDLYFMVLQTDYHFTNYKPDFMLELWAGAASNSDYLIYVDPDIVMTAGFRDIRQWLDSGVALCEDVNSPIAEFHPKREGWRKYFAKMGLTLEFKSATYVNGGFVGLRKDSIAFLEIWKTIQEFMAEAIGGLNRSSLKGSALPHEATGPFAPFSKTDQDALNAAVEAFDGKSSIMGKEAMAFETGRAILPHALGQPKPWNNSPISRSLKGHPPRMVDKLYWEFVDDPIPVFPKAKIRRMQRWTKLAAFISRFYTRN